MKIRLGFVSNSSGSSYVVFLPKSLSVTEFVTKNWNKCCDDHLKELMQNGISKEDCMTMVHNEIDKIFKIVEWTNYDSRYEVTGILIELFNDYFIASIDSSEGTTIINVGYDNSKTRELITKVLIEDEFDLSKFLNKGVII